MLCSVHKVLPKHFLVARLYGTKALFWYFLQIAYLFPTFGQEPLNPEGLI
jgi:hypothetical protein